MKYQENFFTVHKPDIRIQLIQLIVVAIFSFYLQNKIAVFFLFLTVNFLLLYWDGFSSFLQCLLIYMCMNIPVWFLSYVNTPILSTVIPAFLMMLIRIWPVYLLLKLLIHHTPMNELFYVLDRMHIPKSFSIPLIVVYRYVPTIRQELGYINESLKMRGLNFSFNSIFHMVYTAENYMVPLLARSEKISEELSAASLCKGLSSVRKRTCYTDVRLTIIDYVYLLGILSFALALLYINNLNLSWRNFII